MVRTNYLMDLPVRASMNRVTARAASQGPAGPVGLVLVVDDLVAALVFRPGGPGLGEYVPVGDVLAGEPANMKLARESNRMPVVAVSFIHCHACHLAYPASRKLNR